jgi:hypothetical protein
MNNKIVIGHIKKREKERTRMTSNKFVIQVIPGIEKSVYKRH